MRPLRPMRPIRNNSEQLRAIPRAIATCSLLSQCYNCNNCVVHWPVIILNHLTSGHMHCDSTVVWQQRNEKLQFHATNVAQQFIIVVVTCVYSLI